VQAPSLAFPPSCDNRSRPHTSSTARPRSRYARLCLIYELGDARARFPTDRGVTIREREREREREKERHSGSGIRSEFARHSLNFPLYRFSSPYLLPVGLRQSSNTIWRIRVAIMKRLNDSSFQMRISLPGIYTRTRNLSGILGEFLGLQSSSSAFELCAHTSFDPALIDKGFRLPLESTS